MYRMTTDLASFRPPGPEQELLLASLAGRQADIDRFLAVLSGVVPVPEFFGPANLLRLLGPRGVAKSILARARQGRRARSYRDHAASMTHCVEKGG